MPPKYYKISAKKRARNQKKINNAWYTQGDGKSEIEIVNTSNPNVYNVFVKPKTGPSYREVKEVKTTQPTQNKPIMQTSSRPAPQDELVDLTDDLAPTTFTSNTNIAQYKAPTIPHPTVGGSENKLNFKFQKTTSKSTSDWMKYQNNFKRVSAASPDSDNGNQAEQKDSAPSEGQSVDLTNQGDQGTADNPFLGLPSSVMEVVKEKLKELPGKKPIIMPKVEEPTEEVQKKETKEAPKVSQNVSSVSTPEAKDGCPIQVRFQRNNLQDNQPKEVKPTVTGNTRNTFPNPNDYPKGVPKSFLKQKEISSYPGQNALTPPSAAVETPKTVHHMTISESTPKRIWNYDYPKGIPRSFLRQQGKSKIEPPSQPTPTPVPSLPNTVPEYQFQTGLDLPSWILGSQLNPGPLGQQSIYTNLELEAEATSPTFGQHEPTPNRAYSPSDVYSEAGKRDEAIREGSESPDMLQSGQKRLSAFQRLGPLTKPKKPKLTINLMFNKEQSVREVVDESSETFRFVPVHLRRDILESNDEIVKKYLPFWPWKKNLVTRKSVSARNSKSVMILEQEQMEEGYEKDNKFIQVSVKGYPPTWTKENVLDAILECVKGKSFIPCFIEFTSQECKFLVIRSRAALVTLHKVGFCIRSADVELTVTISLTDTTLNQIDLIPRLILRKRLLEKHVESGLDLSSFLAAPDVSHFMYFPLNRVTNQVELVQMQSAIAWEYLTDLNLSNNRIANLDGLDLQSTTPRLRRLDLSHNLLEKVTVLLKCKDLPLRSITLEGNPLCLDYIDGAHYIKVVKMMFSGLRELDGEPVTFKGDLLPSKPNYCPEAAVGVAEKFLETFFPLLEANYEDRTAIEAMYDKDAVMTVTFRYKLRYGSAFRYFRNLFVRSRNLEEGDMESVRGAPAIAELVSKWPALEHDRYTITVDAIYHDESTTILRLGGVLKLTAETLAEDEHLLTFTRTVVLHTKNGAEYKILNEMLYWDVPREEIMKTAFNITTVRSKQLSVKLESPPDDHLKSKLLSIFVKIADIDKKRGSRCLERKNWDLRSALEYYTKLLKLDDLSPLNDPEKDTTTTVPQAS